MATTKTITTNLGGNRLGSGAKNNITLHAYNRSNHDLSRAWRSSMNCGTLVPFLKIVGLPGDTFSIDLKPIVRTIPTIGPLYGAYKLQMDVFEVPIRLYNGLLHNNMTKIGLDMKKVKLPTMIVQANVYKQGTIEQDINQSQISSSSLLNYLGLKGVCDWRGNWGTDTRKQVYRTFNAIPLLAYWDIYKCYYANKQEEKGVMITKNLSYVEGQFTYIQERGQATYSTNISEVNNGSLPTGITLSTGEVYQLLTNIHGGNYVLNGASGYSLGYTNLINWTTLDCIIFNGSTNTRVAITNVFNTATTTADGRILLGQPLSTYTNKVLKGFVYKPVRNLNGRTTLKTFNLKNIDDMRVEVLRGTRENWAVDCSYLDTPFIDCYEPDIDGNSLAKYPQNGLAIKTYQSDLLQNWLQTEWIDGVGGINEITAVDTSSGNFQIDALNLANKVYNMLNRIAVSDGTYESWQEAVYSVEANRRAETPIYKGGMACEIMFEEVVSTTSTEDQPLGTLAGKGRTVGDRGGHLEIRVTEPSYIMGIVSITPRIDYSQGNDWDVTELETMDDLHKPALDGIGFEDLLQERAAWFGTVAEEDPDDQDSLIYKKYAMGKTPAWMNYMTAVNECHGDFAELEKNLWMTLNRQYEYDTDPTSDGGIKDLTTYVDPRKFNYTFADASLEAQNFWVQIGIKCFARRVMSAKILPNL